MNRRHLLRLAPPTVLLVLLAGCGSPEILEPYRGGNSASVDLSGQWELRGNPAAIERRIQRAIRETDGLRDDIFGARNNTRSRSRAPRRSSGGLAHVFFENGESLKITQTPTALFISFNRAIVEEYRFGEQRRISVGQAEAQRVSGWDGSSYVIETLDRNGMKMTERYALAEDGRALVRTIVFRSKERDTSEVVQTFERG